ncbi:MAG: maleylpyruvate isomerase N-terminal domain-containing protein, partial [Solirubrobacterales bacterium]|nr:maleylpyruvate isomerase N-terminal domain-containing protein [Solirubrobacterales bacterium]
MADSGMWDTIHAERRALAVDVDDLTDEQWSRPSLCDGWSVWEV